MNDSIHHKVAIITRTKNRPVLLERNLQSVLNQSFSDYVHVIVNDGGSVDEVNRVVDQYQSQYTVKPVVIHNLVSQGMEAAANIGIDASRSDYLVVKDDDDTWHPDFLSTTVKMLDQCHFAGVVVDLLEIHESWDKQTNHIEILKKKPFYFNGLPITLEKQLMTNRVIPIAFIYRRSAYELLGAYDESLAVCGDWEFHTRFVATFQIHRIPQMLANYHIRHHNAGDYANSIADKAEEHRLNAERLQQRWRVTYQPYIDARQIELKESLLARIYYKIRVLFQ